MSYSVLSNLLSVRWLCLLLLGVMTSCGQIAASEPEEDTPNNPFAQFRQAVNEVEPLIDPNLESLTSSRFQLQSPIAKSAVTLPVESPLEIQGNVTVISSPTLQVLNQQMYQRLIQAGYGGVLDINVLRARAAIQQFCQNPTVDVLMVNRPLSEAEVEACQGRRPLGLTIGKDPLLLVVNKDNQFVRGINLEKLKAVLTRNTWAEVDPSWPNTPIERAMIGPNSSTIALLTQKLFPTDGAALVQAANTTFYDYPEPMVQRLSSSSSGLAFINASIHKRFTQTFRVIPIDGISASVETVENNVYPLVQSLFLYVDQTQLTSDRPTKAVVNFYLTEMMAMIPEVGLSPLNQAQFDQTKRQWLKATGGN